MERNPTKSVPGLIGMVHIPINTIIASPAIWRDSLKIPASKAADWPLIAQLQIMPSQVNESSPEEPPVRYLSFYNFLEDRMLEEATVYVACGYDAILLENVAAPYFVRGEQPPVIYWVMRTQAARLRAEQPSVRFGIQILAYSDDLAMDIACNCGFDFIRCESALFEGVRPEGRTPNEGNLARLYLTRNQFLVELGKDTCGPQVWVDLRKKHTVFDQNLSALDLWLENILFQKLEGIIITGKATGCPVAEEDLRRARDAIEKARSASKAATGLDWAPPLIAGSGASIENIEMYKRYADAVIVGSSVKKKDYWECPLDEDRVRAFAEAWNKHP